MGEAYGGGVLGRIEQFFDAIPGGMRGPQAPIVRGVVTGGIVYGALLASAPINSYMFFDSGEAKPFAYSQEGINAGPENSAVFTPTVVALLAGAAAGTFI